MGNTLTIEREGIRIVLEATRMGGDVNVSIFGGDKPHIGSVAVAQARPSLDNAEKISASTSVITILGHKEDMLARKMAAKMAAAVNGIVSVACGIHVDGADDRQISTIVLIVEELVESLLQQLKLSETKH